MKEAKRHRRAHGEGTILKRKDGRWAAVIDLGSAESGRKRKWFYGATQAEVRDKLTEARNRQHSGLPVEDAKQTLAQFRISGSGLSRSRIRSQRRTSSTPMP